jgi:hypothetical protein
MKRYKSPGIDQIPAELIKAGDRTFRSEIHKPFNSIGNREDLLEEWKKSIIVAFYKKDDETDCSNYRGISLLSTTYQILSNISRSRLTPYAEENIGDSHFGLRRNRSTIDYLFCIRKPIEKKWEYSEAVHQLLTDFKKV